MNARLLSTVFFPVAALAAGCTLVNSFDEVKPLSSSAATGGAGGGSSGAGGSTAGTGGGTGGSTAGTGGAGGSTAGTGGAGGSTAGTGGGGAGGATGGAGGNAGTGGAAGGGPLKGAVAMSGLVPGMPDQHILTVLDMGTGNETTREQMTVSGIVHDPLSDTFFVFDSATETDPAPGDMVTLRARKLDMTTGKWLADAGTLTVPANVRGSAVALHDRVVFLTYPGGMGTKRALVVVDTKDLGAMKVLSDPSGMTFSTGEATAVIGSRDQTSTGGIVGLAGVSACNATMKTCDASILPISVTDSGITYLARKSIGTYEFTVGASMAFGAGSDRFFAAFPPVPPAKGYVQSYTTTSLSKAGAPAPFDASGPALKALAYNECDDISFVSELTDQAIFVVPSDPSKPPALQSLGKPGQRVAFDNATKTVIVPYTVTAQHFVRAFKLDPTKPAKPLTERTTDWKPPVDFEPDLTAVRNANPLCP